MTKQQVHTEFRRVSNETHDKPKIKALYPPNVVQTRELLLLAQVELAKILGAKATRNKREEALHTNLYQIIMRQYFSDKKIQ